MTHSREKRGCVMNKNLLTTKTITVMKTEEKNVLLTIKKQWGNEREFYVLR
jgi:hypothetical protein